MGKKALCIQTADFVAANHQLLGSMITRLIDRDICETDPSTLQLLPYVILQDIATEQFFMYTRGKAGQENRLHAKQSIGLGGHVEEEPTVEMDLFEVLTNCVIRELEEEVGYRWTEDEKEMVKMKFYRGRYTLIHLSNSDSLVDRVHLGIALILRCDRDRFSALETGVILEPTWLSTTDIFKMVVNTELDRFENWTKCMLITMSHLDPKLVPGLIVQNA